MKTTHRHFAVLLGLLMLAWASYLSAREMEGFKDLRSYEGAPPVVPHPVSETVDKPTCLSCHQYGGYSPSLKANIPKTPHPELSSCLQCHVAQKSADTFKGKKNLFEQWANQNKSPEKTLESAPPVVPHDPQMRQNCTSCHGGPGAVSEIKTPHPERSNCLQCHVWQGRKEQLIIK